MSRELLEKIIKAYDIRGLVDEEVTPDFTFALGIAFAKFVEREREPATIVVGEDMRPSSPELAGAFSDGITSQGLDVIRIGLSSTDQLYFASGHLNLPGAMFTASHNPAEYNGIKLCKSGARPIGQESGLLGRAKQIIEWHRTHRFCGQCGSETSLNQGDRSYQCGDCRLFFYPRLSPSIIVCVNKGNEILLAKNVNARGNFYSTLAGFVEPGESIETTVHREVFEEVGIRVKNLKYFSSQSWPFPNSLMLGFHAEYDSGDITIQEAELADAQWFPYDQLPNPPAMISISGWLINDFVQRASSGEV